MHHPAILSFNWHPAQSTRRAFTAENKSVKMLFIQSCQLPTDKTIHSIGKICSRVCAEQPYLVIYFHQINSLARYTEINCNFRANRNPTEGRIPRLYNFWRIAMIAIVAGLFTKQAAADTDVNFFSSHSNTSSIYILTEL